MRRRWRPGQPDCRVPRVLFALNTSEGRYPVHDKTVRRRRAVLALLVVLSLLLLTAYFGEAPGGRLHGVQRGFLTVVSPIQNGANKALKPVRDLFGWFGDTLHAKSQRDELRQAGRQTARAKLVADQSEKRSYRELLGSTTSTTSSASSDYHPVTATVVAKSPNIWYSTVTIDKGERRRTGQRSRHQRRRARRQGHAGRLRRSPGGASSPTARSASPRAIGSTDATGIVQPKVGEPDDLLLQYLPATTQRQPRRIRGHLRHGVEPRRLALPAGHPDRAGHLGQRRKRATSRSTCVPRPTCTTSTSCRC